MEIVITDYSGPGGDIVIPSSIQGLPVTTIQAWAFSQHTSLTSVAIPPSVNNIENVAFFGCSSLTRVTIPSSVNNIGATAFDSCRRLGAINVDPSNPTYRSLSGVLFDKGQTTLILYPEGNAGAYAIPPGVTRVGDSAFKSCTGLTRVTIPDSVTHIGRGAFWGCTALANATIPDSVTTIEGAAFRRCTSLTSLTIPDSVTSILTIGTDVGSVGAFEDCTSLTSVTIPSSVTSIGDRAFAFCTALSSATIGSSVTRIGDSAFVGCSRLTLITVDATNPTYSSSNGVLFDKHQTVLILCPEGKAGAYTVPSSVTRIADRAFAFCGGLTSATIGHSVTVIEDSAFVGCSGLGSVYFRGNAPIFKINYPPFSCPRSADVFYLAGTSGWGNTFADRPTALWIPVELSLPSTSADNPLRLVTSTATPERIRVQRSRDLLDWEDWVTVTPDHGPIELEDAEVDREPHRFYRGVAE
jgi:hypothetical protein